MKTAKTVYVIFTSVRDFPNSPAYEGDDVKQAARTLLNAADEGKATSIRIRWKGKLIYGLKWDIDFLTQEITNQRNAKPKEANQHGFKY